MKLPKIILDLFQNRSDLQKGFTLLEAVITISVVGILAAVVTPTYIETQTEAKLVMSEANASQLKQGIVNLYLRGFMDGEYDVWPDEPVDHKMTHQWAATTVLYDGRTLNQLYSSSTIIYNPYGKPFLYYLLPKTDDEEAGFRIDDPDTGVSQSFRP
ncbi:MAG: type II secretion system protein [Candidatus Marinimicrobia bacterium]|nr:type II secretion system protein [FCB group bacterium]MBL7026251.1 type II secretion system protein [Candidatus Neomarinimicrobiota bacterium]